MHAAGAAPHSTKMIVRLLWGRPDAAELCWSGPAFGHAAHVIAQCFRTSAVLCPAGDWLKRRVQPVVQFHKTTTACASFLMPHACPTQESGHPDEAPEIETPSVLQAFIQPYQDLRYITTYINAGTTVACHTFQRKYSRRYTAMSAASAAQVWLRRTLSHLCAVQI